jgi:hypothetical protein
MKTKHPKLEAAWNQYEQLRAECDKLRAKGSKFRAERDKRYAESILAYVNAVIETYGEEVVINWGTGEIKKHTNNPEIPPTGYKIVASKSEATKHPTRLGLAAALFRVAPKWDFEEGRISDPEWEFSEGCNGKVRGVEYIWLAKE